MEVGYCYEDCSNHHADKPHNNLSVDRVSVVIYMKQNDKVILDDTESAAYKPAALQS